MIKGEFEKTQNCIDNAFIVKTFKGRFFPRPMHYHQECEIMLILNGEGLCFVGDDIINYETGDIFFFSGGLPHFFRSSRKYYDYTYNPKDYNESQYIQFKEDILPANYMNMPGCKNFKHLINNGKFGIVWKNKKNFNKSYIIKLFKDMRNTCYFPRLNKLYILIDYLGQNVSEGEKISSNPESLIEFSKDSIYKNIVEYLSLNFHNHISLDDLAKKIGMNKSSMCRYFKKKTGESIFSLLLKLRISYAKNQISNTDYTISQIAFDSGFNNISHFNVKFKNATGYTPTEYRKSLI